MMYHFEGFGEGAAPRAGAYVDERRLETYLRAADDLIELLQVMNSIALRVTPHVWDKHK